MVVSTTACRSRSHHEDKSGLEVRTTSSLHLVVVSLVHLVVEILHLVHLVTVSLVHLVVEILHQVIMSLVYLVIVIMMLCRTWSAAVRKFR